MWWIIAATVMAATSLYVLNRVAPSQGESRVRAHCAVGMASVALAILHFAAGWEGELGFGGGTALGLLLVTAASGMILRFIPWAGQVRYHAASLHSAIVVALIMALLARIIVG